MGRLVLAMTWLSLALLTPAVAAGGEPPAKADANQAAKTEQKTPIIAVFELTGPVMESGTQDLFLFGQRPIALREFVRRMREAAGDERVKAVVVTSEQLSAGAAQVEELRQAIEHVRSRGKEVFVHADTMRLGEYLLASGATRVSVVPTADILVLGLHARVPYLRGLLDKVGTKPEFIQLGTHKSGAEIFTRQEPSPEADAMMNWLFDSLFESIVQLIAEGRDVSPEKARQWIDKGLYTAEEAKEAGLIDAVEHRQEFDAMLKGKFGKELTYERQYGVKKGQELDLSSPFALFKILGEMFAGPKPKTEPEKPAVGIVYVEGMILPGTSRPSIFGASAAYASDVRKALDQAARDDSIKAVVLRVDSPGGSAVASEIILDATRRVKEKKPLVVSMGNVAGSGGYYVSLGADTLFADATTLTGSIGALAGKLVTTETWNKLGVTFKSYKRGARADLLSGESPWNDEERKLIQTWMTTVVDQFKEHVVAARGQKLKKPLDEIAGGRVYTGKQAQDLGLIDKIGTLHDAIHFAAKEANVKDYDVRVVPQPRSLLEQLLEQGSGGGRGDNKWIAAAGLSTAPSLFELAEPHLRHLDPARVDAIRSALLQLGLLAQENVILTMPQPVIFE